METIRQDRETYQRGLHAALLGLAVQLALAVAMSLVGLWAESDALYAATWYYFGGLPIWIILAMVYYQHRIERLEALQSQQLAQRDAAIFEQDADADYELASRRLAWLYKWGLGVISALSIVYLLALGAIYLYRIWGDWARIDDAGVTLLTSEALGDRAEPKMLLGFAMGMALVGFIVARYIAGMTRVREWQLLRGGASYLMGSAVIALLTAAAALAMELGVPEPMGWLRLVVPIFMLLLAVEALVFLLLSIYRPRRPGEVPRPAFDSRITGFLTSPESLAKAVGDTLNYQFGFEISRSWFYQLLSRAITPLLAFSLLVLLGVSCLVVVEPDQQAVITYQGRVTSIASAGLHVKWPWPLGRAELYNVNVLHEAPVGSYVRRPDPTAAVLWAKPQESIGEKLTYLVAQGMNTTSTSGDGGTTGGGGVDDLLTGPAPAGPTPVMPAGEAAPEVALVIADITLHFRIKNLEQFVRNVPDPQRVNIAYKQRQQIMNLSDPAQRASVTPLDPCPLLTMLAQRRVTTYFGRRNVDQLLTGSRAHMGEILKQQIQQDVDHLGLGLEISYVSVTSVQPPQTNDVAKAFLEQMSAALERESEIEDARRRAIKIMGEVAGSHEQALAFEKMRTDGVALKQRLARTDEPKARQALAEQVAAKEHDLQKLVNTLGGQAAEIIAKATGDRLRINLKGRADLDRFQAEYDAYQQAPVFYMMRNYLATLAESLADRRKYVVFENGRDAPVLRLDLSESTNDLGGLLPGQESNP